LLELIHVICIAQNREVVFVEHSQIILKTIKERDISAYKLSKETGISESLFSKWKKSPTSEISSSTLARIAEYLGCSVDCLLGRDEQKEKPTPKEGSGLTDDQRYLIDAIYNMSAANVKKLRIIVDQVIAEREK